MWQMNLDCCKKCKNYTGVLFVYKYVYTDGFFYRWGKFDKNHYAIGTCNCANLILDPEGILLSLPFERTITGVRFTKDESVQAAALSIAPSAIDNNVDECPYAIEHLLYDFEKEREQLP